MKERGMRLREIRVALGLSQYNIVMRLNDAAARLGLPANYRYYTVSRNEAGTISFEDAAVWLAIDPAHHSWEWFVFGAERRAVKHPPPQVVTPAQVEPVLPAKRRRRKRTS